MDSFDVSQSLRGLFDTAETKRQAIETSLDSTSTTYALDLESAISLYAKALDRIAAVSLFSPNEGIEDVNTEELPLLLTHFHIAELMQRAPRMTPPERSALLRRARVAYNGFLNLVDMYGLVASPYDRLLERYRDNEDNFAVVSNGADMAAKRNGKIAAFQAEKQLKAKLDILKRNPRYLEHGDEELVRELYLTNITFRLHQTFNSLDSLNRELCLLSQAPDPNTASATSHQNRQIRETENDPTLRLDHPMSRIGAGGPLLSKTGKPLQPFTLLGSDSRQGLRQGVFRSGHNLPTMSIDEYLEEEKRRGNILQGGVEPKTVIDEDDMEVADRETYKAREWDEFKDSNAKGAGNTMNMG